jgi:hypothetical protein
LISRTCHSMELIPVETAFRSKLHSYFYNPLLKGKRKFKVLVKAASQGDMDLFEWAYTNFNGASSANKLDLCGCAAIGENLQYNV